MSQVDLRLEVDGQLLRGALEGPLDSTLPAVVYLHGFGSRAFGDKGEFFSSRFTGLGLPFCRFDLRGHGESGGRLAEATVERNLIDLQAVVADLRRRGWSEFVFMGSSWGALTAIVHCCKQPEGVLAGVFIAPAIGIADSIRRREGQDRLEAWRSAGEAPIADGDETLSWDFYVDSRRWRRSQLALELHTPSLLFHGTEDEEVEWIEVHRFASECEAAQLHTFVGADHRLLNQLPTIWSETERFLRPFVGAHLAASASDD